jgi:protein-disulfide isomerase
MSEQSKGFFDGSPKMMYIFGLVSGMAVVLLLNNFTGTSLAANFGGDGNDKIIVPPVEIADPDGPPKELAPVTADEHIQGDVNKAKVFLVEYSDFQCPFCSRHHPTLQKVMEDYGDQVAWVYRHFPLTSIHPQAEPAANASECASEQGKFWEYADALFENQTSLSDDYYGELAGDLGLNVSKFNDCFENSKYQGEIDADAGTGRTAGVTGTPATFINGQAVSGAVPYSTFKQIIDAELAK